MSDVIANAGNAEQRFVFTGNGWRYFIILLVNFLFVFITLGIYFSVGDNTV